MLLTSFCSVGVVDLLCSILPGCCITEYSTILDSRHILVLKCFSFHTIPTIRHFTFSSSFFANRVYFSF